ncbi:MAG: hypothetical protein R3E39_24895 [Anaerolineae bacterium]
MNKKVARLGTAALLVASLSAGAMVVGAQDTSGSTADSTTQVARPNRGTHPLAIIAEQLGLQPAELMTELQGGKTIAQLAEEKGVSLDSITEAIVADHKTALDQAVTDGNLTQAQVDARLALVKADVEAMYDRAWQAPTGRPGFGPADGFGGMNGGMGRPGRGQGGFGDRGQGNFGGRGQDGFGGMWGNGPQNAPVAPTAPDAEATVTPNA